MPQPSSNSISQSPILRFAGVGALSTAIDMLVFNLLLLLNASVYVAGGIGFFAGFSNGYFFNSRYVFKQGSRERYAKYLLVSLGGLLITEIILHLLHVELGMEENISKLVAVGIVFFWNYGLSKFWVFA
ncbi:MAG TPA: GtrA family protein [Verrucomicrobiae bacterium]|nr:GtrA family protein [Verrucomicrobiae bacterium]